jgi:SecE/Sec61-gamma subunits of protein translocation complex
VAPSWQEAANTTAAVLASITVLAALVTVVDSFWLAVYQVLPDPTNPHCAFSNL